MAGFFKMVNLLAEMSHKMSRGLVGHDARKPSACGVSQREAAALLRCGGTNRNRLTASHKHVEFSTWADQ
jgi:hypothetical protein